MSEAYAGKSDQQIIDEQAQNLDFKGDYQQRESFNPRTTVLSEQSGVNESGLDQFPGASVSVGRTGQTGGGTNPQNIPPEEGGDGRSQRTGESSARFEGLGGPEDKRHEALKQNPGGFDAKPRGIDQTRQGQLNEPVPRTEDQALEADQEATARSHAINS
ncbi:uncharacterized protein PFL1_05368 [Pseudozyma flocculosa PF-1]|uniref:Uncharacterized protein n=2 Tax=Pseudozyma flocculosa TaxID=84751 RepID=A0A5C3FA66_9BASI|nr:uncharacterized protein PFL1_05368 [Pseudozyma flocculosa PF-1]EPQ27084.1 hypothetical protein PFL1_05368 [Pseudozyma flocculosa PF-1]SPO41348.1 uncharacterized protein PSFLO_06830 [Pseudozyma flocculosa]